MIRTVEKEDINPLVELSSQLGYPVSLASVHETVQRIQADPKQKLFLASEADYITGWVHVFLTDRVESGCFAEIGGLVVDRSYRRQGIGNLLVEHAAHWACELGAASLRVRVATSRRGAHKFYKDMGMVEYKTQLVFERSLTMRVE